LKEQGHISKIKDCATAGLPEKRKRESKEVGGWAWGREDVFSRGFCLLSGTAMTEEDFDRVISVIRRCRN
jgi:hypothetical protein